MKVSLVLAQEDGTTRDLPEFELPFVIGRDKSAKVRIPAPAVSRNHCELLEDDEELIVRDLGSSNGTYVNGARVTERELIPGDLLCVGPAVLVVRIDGRPDEVDGFESYMAGIVEPGAEQASAPSGAAGAGVDQPGGLPSLVEDGDPDDSDFELDLSALDDDDK